MNEQELIKKLLEFAGLAWEYNGIDMEDEHGYCHRPFTKSLDACLEWLVPKLTFWQVINYNGIWTRAYVWAGENSKEFGSFESSEEIHSALALCLAIEKLIDGGEK